VHFPVDALSTTYRTTGVLEEPNPLVTDRSRTW